MKTAGNLFANIVDSVYQLSLEDKLELQMLLEHNITDQRRDEILQSFHLAQAEEKNGQLTFSSDTGALMNML